MGKERERGRERENRLKRQRQRGGKAIHRQRSKWERDTKGKERK